MWYLIVTIVLALGFLFSNKLSAQTKEKLDKNKEIKSEEDSEIVNDSIKPLYSKEQIEAKLKYLAETPPPTELAFGAMCYSFAEIKTDKLTYICPVCGERTIYKSKTEKDEWGRIVYMLNYEIQTCQREVLKVKGVNIRLDESQFCGHCSAHVKKPELCLLINIGGTSDTTKVCDIDYLDIRKIQEFLNGDLIHKTSNDRETPLVNKIERIKQLLGFEYKEGKREE
jgi:hypothetical protein